MERLIKLPNFSKITIEFNNAKNVSLWLRMPKEMHTIDEARYAYDLLKEIRKNECYETTSCSKRIS